MFLLFSIKCFILNCSFIFTIKRKIEKKLIITKHEINDKKQVFTKSFNKEVSRVLDFLFRTQSWSVLLWLLWWAILRHSFSELFIVVYFWPVFVSNQILAFFYGKLILKLRPLRNILPLWDFCEHCRFQYKQCSILFRLLYPIREKFTFQGLKFSK